MIRNNKAFIVPSLMFTLCTVVAARTWPEIRESQGRIHVENADSPKAGLELTVKGLDGKDLYKVKCHSGNYESNSDSEDYSGLMQCYVTSTYSKESVSNLLTETYNQISDWSNRGRFLSSHLDPPCSNTPEWGRLRHFRLRGMEITLEMSNVRFSTGETGAPSVKSYDFEVSARPMPNATKAIAEAPNVPQPSWFYTARCPAK